MRIITLEKDEFDSMAKKHKYESCYQISNYGELESFNGYDVHYLGFTDDDENLIGGAMCLIKNLFGRYKYAYIPRGLLIDYDNPYLVNKITVRLRKLLKKQKFVFVKIDPPVVASERNFDGKINYLSNTVNQIINTLKRNNYRHMGFNLYYETKLPRWNLFLKLNNDPNTMFASYDEETKTKVRNAHRNGIELIEDTSGNTDTFYEIVKKSYGRFGRKYFQNLYKAYGKDAKIDILYSSVNSSKFVSNANHYYSQEEERNINLANIISGNDTYKYNIQKVISDKMDSDKKLHQYKKDVVAATEFLKKYPDGKILAASLVIKHEKGADCLILFEDKDFANFNGEALLIYEMSKKYGNQGYKYLNLGPATGNFDKKSPYYKKIANKKGFNTFIIEYIGEFNLIVNPLMYKWYEYKENKKKNDKKR